MIESTGISEPLPVAETFTFPDEQGVSLSDVARLDTLVTVVDAVNFPDDLDQADSLQARGESLGEEDQRTVADLLIDQVEFADVIIVNKIDLISQAERERLTHALRQLNRDAEIVPASFSEVPLNKVLDTGKFSFEKAATAPGWLQEMRGEHTPETEEYGIASFVYRARRPFHPARFHQVLQQDWEGNLLRSKGYFWLASRHDIAGAWSQAGGIVRHGPAGYWWSAVEREHWPQDESYVASIKDEFRDDYGDRRQELVFIGQHLDRDAIIRRLDACLLDDEEYSQGPAVWQTYPDLLPNWVED